MSFALLFHYLMLNMFRMLIHPSSGACDLFVELFHGLYCSGSMCWCYFVVWLGWCGIWMQAEALVLGVVSVCRLKHCFSLHTDTTPPQPNHNVTPTHIEPEQYNPWNISQQISRKLLKMDVLTFETCRALSNEIIKQVISSWFLFI